MEEEALSNVANLTQEDVNRLIKDFPIQPLRNRVIISVNVDEEINENGVKLSSSHFAETQYVLAVGGTVREFVPGQKVLLDIEKMMEYRSSATDAYEKVGNIKLRPVEVNGKVFALINDSVIDAVDAR